MSEIQNIFNVYDLQEKGIMEYKKFLKDLLLTDELSRPRKQLLKDVFNHIDYEGRGALDIKEMTNIYKTPDPNVLPDLLDAFNLFHNITRGSRNPLVNLDEFTEYYSNINFLIPETKGDKLFNEFTSEGWCLYDKSFDERKNLIKNKVESLGKQKNREMRNKLVGSDKVPYGTIKDKINYNLNEANPTIKYNINKIEDIIIHLRNILSQRGFCSIMSMRRTFLLLDVNNNKKIPFKDFESLFKKYRYDLSDKEIKNLFNYFDDESTGYIYYPEFVNAVLGDLKDCRKNVLKQVFDKLDINESGFITPKIMREEYNPKGNPLVRQGKRSEEEILADFIDLLEYHFNLLNDKNEDGGDINTIKVDFDDFCDFYKNVSVCIEDDKLFEIMLMGEWGLKKDGKNPYQKEWNKQDA